MGRTLDGTAFHHPWPHIMMFERPWGIYSGDDDFQSLLMLISNARLCGLQVRVNHQVDEFLKPDGRLPP